jgi:hypothetical protein
LSGIRLQYPKHSPVAPLETIGAAKWDEHRLDVAQARHVANSFWAMSRGSVEEENELAFGTHALPENQLTSREAFLGFSFSDDSQGMTLMPSFAPLSTRQWTDSLPFTAHANNPGAIVFQFVSLMRGICFGVYASVGRHDLSFETFCNPD